PWQPASIRPPSPALQRRLILVNAIESGWPAGPSYPSGGSAASPRRPVGSGGSGGGGNKVQTVKVVLLDDTVNSFQVPCRVPGQELFNAVVKKLRLLEIDYFDLEFLSKEGRQCWLDHSKTLPKQCPSSIELVFYFSVKFYPPDPHLLEDEFTSGDRRLPRGRIPGRALPRPMVKVLPEPVSDRAAQKNDGVSHHSAPLVGLSPRGREYSLLDTVRKVRTLRGLACTPLGIVAARRLRGDRMGQRMH
uniref:FERM domain-containing protein n=1 Tax=Macrostomum lignano TaxID=282301 RepID=A0A1I8IJC8_9PLAT